MSNELTATQTRDVQLAAPMAIDGEVLDSIVINGDLSKLKSWQKVDYYRSFCERLGLDPATQPFSILKLNGKEKLYCDRGGCAQLNKKHRVSHRITDRKKDEDCYIVTAQASTPDGRCTESIGAVPIKSLVGEALCNALMKAETKAKRRATLDLLGLGLLDETEVDSILGAQKPGLPLDDAAIEKLEEEREAKARAVHAENKPLEIIDSAPVANTNAGALQKVEGQITAVLARDASVRGSKRKVWDVTIGGRMATSFSDTLAGKAERWMEEGAEVIAMFRPAKMHGKYSLESLESAEEVAAAEPETSGWRETDPNAPDIKF